ncbi:hypothetical protein Q9290_08200 [Oceanimonas sp. CHS3-5]|uniref:hypothetical protein n=1 Tax=Oceanimonas sp. CHS3-5 TaxID=3068186 RepID=UPI00273D49F9|nr:hypothetical protein [Oceanimonas sp. CHS3-5]MDP5292267.1 hypothetical protein [Oceanimonas sp. CHS3-5]
MINKIVNVFRPSKGSSTPQDVIIHIGSPKCGSSAVQRFCIKNREKLLELGYYYPEHSLDSNGVSGGHTQVAGALIQKDISLAKANLTTWLTEAKTRNATLLLSAEAFYGQHNAIAELCEGVKVTVIAFLRHPADYLLANHNQGIKRHMETRRLSELLPVQLGQQTGHLAGLPLLHWADKFGDDNCIFMPYQSPSAGSTPLELQFLMAAGIPEKNAKALTNNLDKITNRSYVKSALELKRLLNTVLPELPAQYAHEIDWALQHYSDNATDEHAFTQADLGDDIREKLNHHLLSQMKPVVKRFPQLESVTKMASASNTKSDLNLSKPLKALEESAPIAVNAVIKQAVILRDSHRDDYAFCKLLDVLGIEFAEPKARKAIPGLTAPQKQVLNSGKAQPADCLRELAVLLEKQNLLQDAHFAISAALKNRPNGEGIKRIKARIEQKINTQKATLKAH